MHWSWPSKTKLRWAIDNAFTEQRDAPDFQQLISADALRTVKPAAVTVLD